MPDATGRRLVRVSAAFGSMPAQSARFRAARSTRLSADGGDSAAPNPSGQMGTYAIDSAKSVYAQLGTLYGTSLTTSQLWEMVGVTPMIGVNGLS